MNLQVCVPYEKCPFKCPMCIANGRKQFTNLYKENKKEYLNCLEHFSNHYEDIILTGNTDPTLNTWWLNDVLSNLKGKSIELQTKNYNLKGYKLKGLTTLSYSITDVKSYLKAWDFRKIKGNNRLVILLTTEFQFLNKDNFDNMGYNQITFKVLHKGNDELTNSWVEKNKLNDLTNIYEIVNRFNGTDISVRVDASCQDSTNRYDIFREDGALYDNWEDE